MFGSAPSASGTTLDKSCLVNVSEGPQLSPPSEVLAFTIKLTNADSRACRMDGYPKVRLLGSNAVALPFTVRDRQTGAFNITSNRAQPFILKAFASAYFLVQKQSCLTGEGREVAMVTVLAPSVGPRTLPWVLSWKKAYPTLSWCTGRDATQNDVVTISPVDPYPPSLG
jgi:hypothetical protein